MAPTYDRIRSIVAGCSGDWFGQQIDSTAENSRKASLDSRKSDYPDPGSRIQLHNKIDIAGRAGLAARQRAEQADMADSSLSQLRRMVAQRRDHLLGRRCWRGVHGKRA